MKEAFVALLAGMIGCAFVQPISMAGAATFAEKVLYSFCAQQRCTDGEFPAPGLIDVNGVLYGVTDRGGGNYNADCFQSCGTAFSLDPSTSVEKVIFAFCRQFDCSDGANPGSALIALNGELYGTTDAGGTQGGGTVFSLDPKRGAVKVLYSFCSRSACADGESPANLIYANGLLYGTTLYGGTGCDGFGCGTVFSIDPYTGAESTLYAFCSETNCADGSGPYGALVYVNGALYGTAVEGGLNNGGTVFVVNPRTRAETVLYSFCAQENCADGEIPAALIDVDGMLYGTTQYGGTGEGNYCTPGCGSVFSLDPSTGAEAVLYSFTGGINWPLSLMAVKGKLYGTTVAGGQAGCGGFGCGTVFSFDPSTGAETVLYSFCAETNCADGSDPNGPLIHVKGAFFGTTGSGGTNGSGTVFVLQRAR